MSEKYFIQKQTLDGISDVIREATGSTEPISFDTESIKNTIETAIETSGTKLPTLDNPASVSDMLSGKEAIDKDGNKITGTIPTKTSADLTASGSTITVPAGYFAESAIKSIDVVTQATPTISVDSAGKITASLTQSAGFTAGGTKTATKQLTVQAAKTITPSTTEQTAVESGRYITGAVKVKGDANLKAENIAEGVSIFGVTGTHSGGGASVETCTVTIDGIDLDTGAQILIGYTALCYINGEFVPQYVVPDASTTIPKTVIENVVCGSCIDVTSIKPMDTLVIFNTDTGEQEAALGGAEFLSVDSTQLRVIVKAPTIPINNVRYALHWSS